MKINLEMAEDAINSLYIIMETIKNIYFIKEEKEIETQNYICCPHDFVSRTYPERINQTVTKD